MKTILASILLVVAMTVRIEPSIQPNSQQCFYEHLYLQTKYRFHISPKSQNFHNYSFQLQFLVNETAQPKVLYHHNASLGVDQEVNLHKFASQQGIHGFCIQNNEPVQVIFRMKLESGIQLMQLDVLPGATETELLDSELKLLHEQYKAVLDSLTSIEGSKSMTQQMLQLMSSKTLGFGIIGIGVIILINAVFYNLIKKALIERKRI